MHLTLELNETDEIPMVIRMEFNGIQWEDLWSVNNYMTIAEKYVLSLQQQNEPLGRSDSSLLVVQNKTHRTRLVVNL